MSNKGTFEQPNAYERLSISKIDVLPPGQCDTSLALPPSLYRHKSLGELTTESQPYNNTPNTATQGVQRSETDHPWVAPSRSFSNDLMPLPAPGTFRSSFKNLHHISGGNTGRGNRIVLEEATE